MGFSVAYTIFVRAQKNSINYYIVGNSSNVGHTHTHTHRETINNKRSLLLPPVIV